MGRRWMSFGRYKIDPTEEIKLFFFDFRLFMFPILYSGWYSIRKTVVLIHGTIINDKN